MNTKDLSAKQLRAIELIATKGFSKADAALEIGVNIRTLTGWFGNNAKFSEAFQAAKEKIAADNENRHQKYKLISEKAIERLCALTECGDPRTELAAVKEILSRLDENHGESADEVVEIPPADKLMEAVLEALRGD